MINSVSQIARNSEGALVSDWSLWTEIFSKAVTTGSNNSVMRTIDAWHSTQRFGPYLFYSFLGIEARLQFSCSLRWGMKSRHACKMESRHACNSAVRFAEVCDFSHVTLTVPNWRNRTSCLQSRVQHMAATMNIGATGVNSSPQPQRFSIGHS